MVSSGRAAGPQRADRAVSPGRAAGSDASRSVSRILSPPRGWGTAIHLGCRLPGTSCGLTRDLGRAAPGRRGVRPCSTLLRTGFTWPAGHPAAGGLLPHHFTVAATVAAAVSFLWHSPSGRPDWMLSSALLCGVRTFLRRRTARGRPTGLPLECTSGMPYPSSPAPARPTRLVGEGIRSD